MANVLFINSGSPGHFNPTIAVCKELVERGENVVYYICDKYKDKLAGTGVEVRTLPTDAILDRFRSYGQHHLYNVMNGLLKTADIIVPQILEETQDEHYDYMIHDSMFSCGHIIAQKLNIPSISSIASFAHSKQSFDAFTEKLTTMVDANEIKQADQTFNELKQHIESTYNVEVPSRFEVMNNPGDFNLCYVMKGFQMNYNLFDAQRCVFTGPSVIQPQPSGFMDDIDQTRPIIYISLGTVFNQNIAFFNKCFKALADVNASVVVSIGETNRIKDFDEIPDNFIIKSYVPQTELLQHTALFLTHAGMNSTNEAMMMNVPMLAFPQSADQPVVAKQIANLNVGHHIDADAFTPVQLSCAVSEMLENQMYYQRHIEKVKNVQPLDKAGYAYAVDQILAFRNEVCQLN
ncbi:glycosyl transferase [Staphylococcus equorum]|uniref:Glycosyl transferase n=1 Tax=Staphylococcus equorum TaxID=246432 RepID=A0A9X4L7G1_9STAP|nr:macrolide family glycosyltransferase [Staphylococcus equorum]MDG0842021.1 glycosyl transferase [Staphylococcus equorum]MDG0857928.1 glycosyl transferase [Staphylococcus equorum]